MVVRYLAQKIREKHVSSRGRHHAKAAIGAAAAKGKSNEKRNSNTWDCVQWTTQGRCFRGDKSGTKHDPDNEREGKGKGLHDGILEKRTPTGKRFSGKENQPTCFASKKGDCPQGNACECCHPLECFFHQKWKCNFESKCAFKNTKKAGSESKNQKNSVEVAKTLDFTEAEDKITSVKLIAKGYFQHGMSAILATSILQNICLGLILSTGCLVSHNDLWKSERRKVQLWKLYNIVGQVSRSPTALSQKSNPEVVQIFWSEHEICSQKSMGLAQEHI